MLAQEKVWEIKRTESNLNQDYKLTDKLNVSSIMAQVLINRGLKTPQQIEEFLNFDLEDLFDPFLLKGINKAVNRIIRAINNREKIVIYGDYDVDGITSTSLLVDYLTSLEARVDYYIPNRLKEGYGLNLKALDKISAADTDLVITVDCGIKAQSQIEHANDLGLDIIVTDHHTPPSSLPQALAIINPKQQGCQYPFKKLAGVGVAYKLAQAVALELDSQNKLPVLTEYLDLVAFGTVADMVPLVEENRIITKYGLKKLDTTDNFGLNALIEVSGLTNNEINSGKIGYILAPKINAAGRIGDPDLAVKLFLAEDYSIAEDIAQRLDKLNTKRQEISKEMFSEAEELISQFDLTEEWVLVLSSKNWHPGIAGNVASDISEKYYRPTIFISLDENGIWQGSGRSIPGFNIYEALLENANLLNRFGGHKQAAGLSINEDKINKLRISLNKYAHQKLTKQDLKPKLKIEDKIKLKDISFEIVEELKKLAPFGIGNPRPKFVTEDLKVKDFRAVGDNNQHLKLTFEADNKTIDAIAFGMGGLRSKLLVQSEVVDAVFNLEINEWRGNCSLQLNIKDLKIPEPKFVDKLFARKDQILANNYYRGIGETKQFYTKAVGVTFDNRQEIIKKLTKGEQVYLVREPDNEYDQWAIQLLTGDKQQFGYLNSDLAYYLAPYLDAGIEYKAVVSEVTGGEDKNLGVNIFIEKDLNQKYKQQQAQSKLYRNKLATSSKNKILNEIRQALIGKHKFRNKQREALNSLFAGQNTLAIFGTGRGKSAIFQTFASFQAIKYNKMTIILYPLRALVNDQYQSLQKKLSQLGIRVYKGNGSLTIKEREKLNHALENEEVDILLTTPEFIEYNLDKFRESKDKIDFFVVDESHHIGLSSNIFRPTYKRIPNLLTKLDHPLVLAVTATANNEVAQEIVNSLDINKLVIDDYVRDNLKIIDKRNYNNKEKYINKIVQKQKKTIIYVNSREKSIEIASNLRKINPSFADKIIFYNAGLTNQERNIVEDKFRSGEVKVVVSTSAFGEGIDIPNIRHIILYHLNFNKTEFNQQSGRAGRDGNLAYIHLLYGTKDARINKFILDNKAPDRGVLAELYIQLHQLKDDQEEVILTNQEIASRINQFRKNKIQANVVSAGLGILEELNLLQRVKEKTRIIKLFPKPEQKLDLRSSIRYNEGVKDKQAFSEFKNFALNENKNKLLNLVNQPIYPTKLITLKGEKDIEFIR